MNDNKPETFFQTLKRAAEVLDRISNTFWDEECVLESEEIGKAADCIRRVAKRWENVK